MKKMYVLCAAIIVSSIAVVYAGNQYNWGTSNGGAWVTPDDTKTTAGQVLQVSANGGATVAAASTPLAIFAGSSVTINALTPATTGQLVFLLNGGTFNNVLCISSGSTNSSQWVLVQSTTSACK